MEAFRVTGGARLMGSVEVPGAKNSVLKLMSAALLAPGRTTLTKVPHILDVEVMASIERGLGVEVQYTPERGELVMDVPQELGSEIDPALAQKMRASISMLGALVARNGRAVVALPGGDAIGARGLDIHIAGLTAMGADFELQPGSLVATAPNGLRGARLNLDFPSVGATENLLMAAVLADGATVLDNVAREPEIVDLITMLNDMGAQIEGAGSPTLVIEGVEALSPTVHATVPDRIVAGTWAAMAAMTMGDVEIHNVVAEHLTVPLRRLVEMGAQVDTGVGSIRVRMEQRPRAVDIRTLPYPGFATDLQPQFIALNAIAEGVAMVTENLFESRFAFVSALAAFGAKVSTDGHHAMIRGRPRLTGATVTATDVRAGVGLVMAGLVAEGVTTVLDVHHIDRGYANFTDLVTALGGKIERVDEASLSAAAGR
ncbi:MAG: UDP-N-acetylglucosamine 1-carboxyvinyltransferase [Actinobacteria bacterium]|nr:MAG: UDP-N-acetylglucosamine 1-carboxyvinyltransferase [Actinomycetota bacterium]